MTTNEKVTDSDADPLWTDDALNSDQLDELDRKRFADMVAARINACAPGQNSAVFGLVGPWGSGKTTLINFVKTRLEDDWQVAIFSPWATDGSAELQLEFLSALASLLDEDDEKARKAKDSLREYASVCAPLLGAIPVVGGGVAGAASKVLDLTKPPWHKQFGKVSNALASLRKRVLLVADDVDRLDADELLALLKVVRLLGRFPNVHYLIAYDQQTVESLLQTQGLATRSSAFMEKIVQFPFEVPPIAGVVQRRLLTDTIMELIQAGDVRLNSTHSERFSDYIDLLGRHLVTPRAHARFREQLLAFGAMLDLNEVDVVDFVALSFLRVFSHKIYSRIPSWRNALQTGKERTGLVDTSDMTDGDWVGRIRPLVDSDEDARLVKQVLSGLFSGIGSDAIYFKEHEKALSDDAYFQRYFLFGIAEDDVEDQLIESALQGIMFSLDSQYEIAQYRAILESPNNQRAALAYEKSQRRRSGDLLGANLNLVRFLFDRINSIESEDTSFESAQRALWRWAEMEIFNALAEGVLGQAELISRLTPKDVLKLTVKMLRDTRHTDAQSHAALQGLANYYHDRLLNDLVGLLDAELDIHSLVSVVAFLKRDIDLREIGDGLLSDENSELLHRIVRAMVVVNPWQGEDGLTPELAFNSETFDRLFSNDALFRLADSLPVAPPLSAIDTEEISPENRDYFAHAKIKAIAQFTPRG